MANGPGLSWGTGVAEARHPELTADASGTTAGGTACQTDNNIHISEKSESGPAVVSTLRGASPGGVILRACGVDTGYGGSASFEPNAMKENGTSHGKGTDSPSGREFEGRALTASTAPSAPAPAIASSPPGSTSLGHQTHQSPGPLAMDPLIPSNLSTGERSGVSNGLRRGAAGSSDAGSGSTEALGTQARSCRNSAPGGIDNKFSGGDGSGIVTPGLERSAGGGGGAKSSGSGATVPAGAAGGAGGGGGAGGSSLFSFGPTSSMLEHVSREVCEELFADITCALDASAQAALLGPPGVEAGAAVEAAVECSGGGGDGDAVPPTACGAAHGPGRRARVRGRLYYEVLAVYYASRAAADSARALMHLCQLLWDTPWVAPIYALLLHRFLLLPRDTAMASSPTAAATAATAAGLTAAPAAVAGSSGSKTSYGMSYSDPRVKHLNVLAHGARQLLLGDVLSGLSRFQPLWAFLAFEVAGLAIQPVAAEGAGGGGGGSPAAADEVAGFAPPTAALPPVTTIDAVPVTARPWLLAVAAAFLPYYCLDEQVSELARRFPPPVPLEGAGSMFQTGFGAAAGGSGSGSINGGGTAASSSLAGLDFLVVEVTDVLGQINSESAPQVRQQGVQAAASAVTEAALPPGHVGEVAAAAAAAAPTAPMDAAAAVAAQAGSRGSKGASRKAVAGAAKHRRTPPPPPPPLAGLPTITKLRLQSELYSLTSGGGPRYAPPEVRRAAFSALDALFPGGRSLRWFVRWASRTLHLEWLEGDSGGSDDPWASRGWLGWIYWPIHWYTALYGKILLATFQLIYGIVVWRPMRRAAAPEVAGGVAGTGSGGAITPFSLHAVLASQGGFVVTIQM
ncbi:hypothetical protein VOLCADRAFT_97783 [Volvox carteri f. nagariensis]|uniref:Uncharacterized protein n=1 Tax=Volvox carteri f. nagariensis TaxID=3068 RepID=D8UDM3_VOLCA|nr:uncharacterized protein VOLCADRAFT_97783 [Volvox carteri f. nagariensis]EFJ42189.1 hypothetical protein VOLCADRAFT_97783 [Volvox carteri f. nagariensis]|eukprot:XP_002956732.1 hypothetical protein VOLCADRAFT_97783 [Volvox carteri f. nagariensis]